MRIVVAMDSFKGSLSSLEAGNAVKAGILKADPDTVVDVLPLADGGEGTVQAITSAADGKLVQVEVTGPLGDAVSGEYGIIHGGRTAVMEMCSAAGLTLIPEGKRDPRFTTTYGVGEMIRDAINRGCDRFLIGIGGSATNDGGVGMLQALGFHFLDADGNEISRGNDGLKSLVEIRDEGAMPGLADCTFRIMCDVTNPLCGPDGCSAVYGPQKGAMPEMIPEMDRILQAYAKLAGEKYPESDADYPGAGAGRRGAGAGRRGVGADYPGAGAAGGMGFAFRTFLRAELTPGVEIVMEETRLESYIRHSDLVITGEGRLDSQTAKGKAPVGVARIAKMYGKPVIAFAGSVREDAEVLHEHGIDAFFPIVREIISPEEAMRPERAKQNLAETVYEVLRIIER